jgi:hypothetical protein
MVGADENVGRERAVEVAQDMRRKMVAGGRHQGLRAERRPHRRPPIRAAG